MRGSRVTQALPSTSSDVGKGESEIPEEDHSPSYQVSHGQRGRIWPFFSLGCKSIMPQVSGRFCWAIGGKPRPQPASRVTYDNSEKKVKIMATSWHSTWPLLMPDESHFLNLEHEIENLNWDILDTQEMEAVKRPVERWPPQLRRKIGHKWHITGRGDADWGRPMSSNGVLEAQEEDSYIQYVIYAYCLWTYIAGQFHSQEFTGKKGEILRWSLCLVSCSLSSLKRCKFQSYFRKGYLVFSSSILIYSDLRIYAIKSSWPWPGLVLCCLSGKLIVRVIESM